MRNRRHYDVAELTKRVQKGYYTRKGQEPIFGSGRGKRQQQYGDEVRKLANRLASQVKKYGTYDSEAYDLLLEAMEKQGLNERIKDSDIKQIKGKRGNSIKVDVIPEILNNFLSRLNSFTLTKAEWSSHKKSRYVFTEVTDHISECKEIIESMLQTKNYNSSLSKYVEQINYYIDRMMYDYDDALRSQSFANVLTLLNGEPLSIEETEEYDDDDWEELL